MHQLNRSHHRPAVFHVIIASHTLSHQGTSHDGQGPGTAQLAGGACTYPLQPTGHNPLPASPPWLYDGRGLSTCGCHMWRLRVAVDAWFPLLEPGWSACCPIASHTQRRGPLHVCTPAIASGYAHSDVCPQWKTVREPLKERVCRGQD